MEPDCDHPAADGVITVHEEEPGRYIINIGSSLASGPIPDDVEAACRLSEQETGRPARWVRLGDQHDRYGHWWSGSDGATCHAR